MTPSNTPTSSNLGNCMMSFNHNATSWRHQWQGVGEADGHDPLPLHQWQGVSGIASV
jgi:hypothetical protein